VLDGFYLHLVCTHLVSWYLLLRLHLLLLLLLLF
jgi:hypothetical protein